MLILGIDTTEKNIHIALSQDGDLLAEIEENNNKTEELINYIDKLFNSANRKSGKLAAIGVITGPGGYTGTRGGVAVAKTLAQFLKIPLAGFNKPEANALAFGSEGLVATMTDIKKNEVYAGIFSVSNGEIVNYSEPAVYLLENWIAFLQQQEREITLLASEMKGRKELFNNLPTNIKVDFEFYLKPSHINIMTRKRIEAGKASTFLEVSPFYVREAV